MVRSATTRAASNIEASYVVQSLSLLTAGVAALTCTHAVAADASETLEEIVVTAERRSTDLQDTAVSVSVRDVEEMMREGRLTLTNFIEDVPGVNGAPVVGATGNPYMNISIRGVVPNEPGNGSQIPTTAVYADGIYQGVGGDYDLDRIEVLRGPQGTLYGRSATGGVIAAYSRDPVLGDFGGNFSGTFGNFATRDAQAAINVPIGETFAVRLSGKHREEDGYLSVPTTQDAVRAKFLYQPSSDLSILLGVAMQDDRIHQGGPEYALTTPDTVTLTSTTPLTVRNDRQHQYWAKVDLNLGAATLTYMPSFRDIDYSVDVGYVGPPSGAVGINPRATTRDQYVTQELRLTSNTDTGLSWIVGAFHYDNRWAQNQYLQWLGSGALAFGTDEEKTTRDVGLFGEATYPFTDTLRLTLGLRYDLTTVVHTEVYVNNLTQGPGDPSNPAFGLPENLTYFVLDADAGRREFHNLTYKLRLEKDLTPANLIYGMVSSGFLPGDVLVGTLANGQPVANPYEDETLTAFEIGSKNRFLEDRLQLNAAAYYYDYSGYQRDVQPTPAIPGSAHIILNSPASMFGGELEAIYLLTPNDRLSATFGAVEAKFDGDPSFDFGGQPVYFSQAVAQERIPGIAPQTFTAAYSHTFQLGGGSSLQVRADTRYTSAYDVAVINTLAGLTYASAKPYVHLDDQTLVNLSANWTSASGNLSIGGYVRNVGDESYKSNVEATYVVDPMGNSVVTWAAVPSVGRTYGANVRVNF